MTTMMIVVIEAAIRIVIMQMKPHGTENLGLTFPSIPQIMLKTMHCFVYFLLLVVVLSQPNNCNLDSLTHCHLKAVATCFLKARYI